MLFACFATTNLSYLLAAASRLLAATLSHLGQTSSFFHADLSSRGVLACTPSSVVVGYHIHHEEGDSMYRWNGGILPQRYTASQPRRQLETSPPRKPQNFHADDWTHTRIWNCT